LSQFLQPSPPSWSCIFLISIDFDIAKKIPVSVKLLIISNLRIQETSLLWHYLIYFILINIYHEIRRGYDNMTARLKTIMLGTPTVLRLAAITTTVFITLLVLFTSSPIVLAQQTGNMTRPVDGYDAHAVGMRHIYGSPDLEAHFFCKTEGNKGIVATCQVYDSNSTNATLIGVEYIISAEQFNSLPEEEKPNWYVINETLAKRANLRIPELSPEESAATLKGFVGTYGKLILTWNPKNLLPSSLPQLIDLHNRELTGPS
jgi:hypothetical protein